MEITNISEEDNPLVSIIVITYNSSKYVLETLESAKVQTYQNIELIVSDDCSTDDTVEICREWIEQNKYRFVRTELITVDKNTGIPANCNRGVYASKGEWVKLIAGDDILKSDCIELNVKFISRNNSIKVVASISQSFKGEFLNKNFKKLINNDNTSFYNSNIAASQQYNILLFRCVIHAPNVFLHNSVFKNIGEFDEEFKFMEDYPYWLRVTKGGYKFYYLNKVTVYYRIHDKSIYNRQKETKLFNDFYRKKKPFEEKYIYPNITLFEKYLYSIDFQIYNLFDLLGLNKNVYLLKIIFLAIQKISPLMIYIHFKFKWIYKYG